jgi:hypothetical protein
MKKIINTTIASLFLVVIVTAQSSTDCGKEKTDSTTFSPLLVFFTNNCESRKVIG